MDPEKLQDILKDKAFAEKIAKLQTPEKVQAAFKEKGIEFSVDEVQLIDSIINKMVENKSTKLSEEDLNEISGGTLTEFFRKIKKKVWELGESDEAARARLAGVVAVCGLLFSLGAWQGLGRPMPGKQTKRKSK